MVNYRSPLDYCISFSACHASVHATPKTVDSAIQNIHAKKSDHFPYPKKQSGLVRLVNLLSHVAIQQYNI